MSKIPYYFEMPIPQYFRDMGWLKNPTMSSFLRWAFAQCKHVKRSVSLTNREIEIEPYEFVFSRKACMEETGLSAKQIRSCIEKLKGKKRATAKNQKTPGENSVFPVKKLEKGNHLLQKRATVISNRFTIYKWSVELFSKPEKRDRATTQQKKGNRSPSYNIDILETIDRDHHPYPSSEKVTNPRDEKKSCMTDELSSIQKKEEPQKIHVTQDVYLTQVEIDQCLRVKGNMQNVKDSIEYILASPHRKTTISNWPNTLAVWKIKPTTNHSASIIQENENLTLTLEKETAKNFGWKCESYFDRSKDVKGLLLINTSGACPPPPVFIPYIDPEFKTKTYKALQDKNLHNILRC